MTADLAATLRDEAHRANERRLLVLAGKRERGYEAVETALEGAEISPAETALLATNNGNSDLGCERVAPRRADALLGRTQTAVVLDCHDECRPNVIGRAAGAVDGGGLLIFLTPSLDAWPDRRDGFDATLAVPPYETDEVAGNFRTRLVETLRAHRGTAIVDVDSHIVEHDGLTDPPTRRPRATPSPPRAHKFPAATYDACLTADQIDAVRAFERLRESGTALVVEADRGRGKSSAAGLAAGALAADGKEILVTATAYRSAAEIFARSRELLETLNILTDTNGGGSRRVDAGGGGRVRFVEPTVAVEDAANVDVVLVDEAAALPVEVLSRLLDGESVAFVTTVHGYEGAGRGFSVRFRARLAESAFEVSDQHMDEPIRYAAGDPVEVWAFRALLLDARPPVTPLVAKATPETVAHMWLSSADLLSDEHRLREAFGLLVAAHYRTEPNDLARLLDAPNVSVHALLHRGHVVSVALLAREGGLPAERRRAVYEGSRIRGHLLPDVLTSQCRDERAGITEGWRVLRIATHHAARSRGLGSRLLDEIRSTVEADWLGVGYGATPELIRFWHGNGFSTVYLSTTRNERSGEHSVLMLAPLTDTGRDLHDRHARWFTRRIGGVLTDSLSRLNPDVVRAVLHATDATPEIEFTDHEWRVLVSAAYGPGLAKTHPNVFGRLALRHLTDATSTALSAREERLLVMRALQARPAGEIADALGYDSTGECMRAFGDAYRSLVECYGNKAAREERARYAE